MSILADHSDLIILPLVRFESSLINFTHPHFCLQLFLGPYYQNHNLLFDYRQRSLEICGILCIIKQSLKPLMTFGIPCLIQECFCLNLNLLYVLPLRAMCAVT